jgi:Flp pilus assembly protein TadG
MRFIVPSTTKKPSLQEGQAIVMIALLILVLFGMLGLAIDSGRGYVDRRDQQTAVDAAALAAGDWYENFPDRIDLVGTVIPKSVALYQNNLRIYSACSQVYYNSSTTGLGYPDDNWTFQCQGQYSLQIEAINTQFNGYEFTYKSSHQLALAFIQIFGGASNISIGAQASAVVGNQRQTPALLTLNPNGPCSTLMHGNGQLTLYGDAYSNGPVCLDPNLGIAGNCYAVSGSCSSATYLCYSPITGNPHNPPCNAGDITGTSYVPAPTLPDPAYLAPERAFYSGAGQSYNRGTWTEMTPGTWNNFSISGGGCYFLDPGVYTWNGG